MQHYIASIMSQGAANGFSTESPEKLHIDFTKSVYHATNKKIFIKQMTKWPTHQDACHRFSSYLQWAVPGYISEVTVTCEIPTADNADDMANGNQNQALGYSIAKHPMYPHLSINTLVTDFSAVDFIPCLTTFLCLSHFTSHSAHIPVLSTTLPVYKQFTVQIPPAPQVTKLITKDVIHAQHTAPL